MVLEWDVFPVVVKVFVIEAYAVFCVVEYLQVEFSFVVRVRFVWVVFADSSPVGRALDLRGGVVSDWVRVKLTVVVWAVMTLADLD